MVRRSAKYKHFFLLVLLSTICLSGLSAARVRPLRADDQQPESFSVVLMPDTQLYALRYPESYRAQATWIKNEAKSRNIKFVIHLGDIVHNNTEAEWKAADAAHKILDGKVPYSMVPGNHDMAAVGKQLTRDTSRYNKTFPPSRFEKTKWYGGHMGETNDNNYCFFEGGGMKFMVVSIEFAPTDKVLEWAGDIITKHSDRRVIIATHCYMKTEKRDTSCATGYRLKGNSGEQIWQKLAKKHANVAMVVSGHVLGVGFQESKNEAGGKVIEMLTDFQGLPQGGNGWLRTLKFVPHENKIYVDVYSPILQRHNKDPAHSFTIDFDMSGTKSSPKNTK